MRPTQALSFSLFVALAAAVTPAHAAPAATAASQDSFRRAALREGWPATREGDLASRWVRAFSAGEAAMRAYNLEHLSRESLAKKPIEERVVTYRKLHERFGRLSLASVVKAAPGELTVKLFDSEAAPHEFVFAVEKTAPYKLVSVSMKEIVQGHGLHGMFGH